MKVALINVIGATKKLMYTPWLPLGIVYLGTVLERNGISVRLIDASAMRWDNEKILKWIKKVQPDIIGFSTLTLSFISTIDIARLIKKENPNAKIVLGHYFATIEAESILRKYGDVVDVCVRGEGENSFLALCQWYERHPDQDPSGILGITYKDRNGKVCSNAEVALENEIDRIPFPNRKLIDFNYKWNINGFEVATTKFTSMISSRGCPFKCTYCSCSKFARQQWRPRSPENIVEEMSIVAESGFTDVSFVDDNFTLRPDRVIKICQLIKKEHIDLNWHVDGRVDQASPEMFGWMHKAGCRVVGLGFESANQRILDLYDKKSKVSQFDRAIRNARKGGIELILGLFMVGAPTETVGEIMQTLNFALRSDIDLPYINTVGVFSGPKLWDDAIAHGWIKRDDLVDVTLDDGTHRQVERWEIATNLLEVSRPKPEYELIMKLVSETKRSIIGAKRLIPLLRTGLRIVKNPYLSHMAADFIGHLPNSMKTIMAFRK
jgi:anaerobic magnesium-protoporphyrin IX monomethyl ester cyclase